MTSGGGAGVGRTSLAVAFVVLTCAALEGGAGCGRSDDVIGPTPAPTPGTGGGGGAPNEPQWREDFEACAEVHDEATLVPVNMFISLDKSGSMADMGKWTAAVSAFTAFFNDPTAVGLDVALRLWPVDTDGCNDMMCSVDDCALPQVALGSLGDDVHRQSLIDLLNATTPEGPTPMSAALEGAVNFGIAQLQTTPDEAVVVVLVTDGEPRGCDEDINNIAALAADGFAAGIPVYVVGIEGANEAQINQIAMAGGTNAGYFVGSTNGEAELLAAMQDIQGQSVSCTFAYPEEESGKPLSPDLMRIEYVSGGETIRVPRVLDASECTDEGGWYLDDPANPMTITLCPTTCATVQGDVQAQVDVAVGCECQQDADCPAGNVCQDNLCIPPCVTDADCPQDPDPHICHEGHCVPAPGDPCAQDTDCVSPLVCIGEQCSLGEVFVGGEEAVQGGAFTCALGTGRSGAPWLALLALLGAGGIGLARRKPANLASRRRH